MAAELKDDMFSMFTAQEERKARSNSVESEIRRLHSLQLQLKQLYEKCQDKRLELGKCVENWRLRPEKVNFTDASLLSFSQQQNVFDTALHIYDLLGAKVSHISDTEVHLTFTSTREGRYHCSYCLELGRSTTGSLHVKKNNLLPFIPVEKILKDHPGSTDQTLHAVATEISKYIEAYNIRDTSMQKALALYEDVFLNSIQSTVARDLMSFVLCRDSISIDCGLSYHDILSVQPSEISVKCTAQSSAKEWLEELQEFCGMKLAKLQLPEALCSILSAIETSVINITRESSELEDMSSSES
ncbi:uncharacterized protein LOC115224124 [Argonauta hians]